MKIRYYVTVERTEKRIIAIDVDSDAFDPLDDFLMKVEQRKPTGTPQQIVDWRRDGPRNGGLLSCGCWNYYAPLGKGPGAPGVCPVHGPVVFEQMNVTEPEDVYYARVGIELPAERK